MDRRPLVAHFSLLLALGCASEASPRGGGGPVSGNCSVVEHVEVPLELFGERVDPPRVLRWGERFAIVASDSLTLKRAADVAVASWQGLDSSDHLVLNGICPDEVCTNVLGSAVLSNPDGTPRLLIADEASAVSMPTYPLRAKAWDASSGGPVVMPLFDAPITAITTRTALEASRDAERALFVLGNLDDSELAFVELGADAAAVAPASTLTLESTSWDCLTIVPTREAGAISAVARTEDGSEVIWHVRELDAQGTTVLDSSLTVPAGEALGYAACPTVVDGSEGFYAQWVSDEQSSLVTVAKRTRGSDEEPVLARFDQSPGVLAGVVGTELVFHALGDGEHQELVRTNARGEPGQPSIVLPPLPASTLEHRRAAPKVLSVEGTTLYVSYELETARVLEAIRCP